jgi:hypothetical protein
MSFVSITAIAPAIATTTAHRARKRSIDMNFVNEASWDRAARVVVGVALLILGLAVVDGGLGVVLTIVAFVPLLTGLVGWCPLYTIFRFRTNRDTHAGSAT